MPSGSQAAVARGSASVYSAEGVLTLPGRHSRVSLYKSTNRLGF